MKLILYALLSTLLVSLISLIGILTLIITQKQLQSILLILVGFSVGALFGDAFIHLLPEIVEENGFTLQTSLFILLGILLFFILEKFIHWHHCHNIENCKGHPKSFAYMNLIGDGLHNFLDGIIIGASYLISIPIGIASTIAIIFHEIPQEIGDFGVLLHAGFTRTKAIIFNFFSASLAILGTITAFFLENIIENSTFYLITLTIGGFIYIAGSDLIPELHKEYKFPRILFQFLAIITGIGVMLLLLSLE